MSNPPRNLIGLSLLLIISAFLVVLFYRGLAEPDEGRYAEIAEDMINSGNWLEMRLLMHRYYEKPPLTYWLVATAFHAFGLRDWAARAPLLINGVLLTGLCWFLARRQWEKNAANIATLTMLSMVGFLASMALLMTDPFLALWFALVCIALFRGCQPGVYAQKRFLLFSVAAIAVAMGFLTKGAVAIVLPLVIIFLWLLWERRLAVLRSLAVPWAILLGIGLLTPIMLLLEKHNPGFFHYFATEHFSRFNGTRPTQIHKEPFVFFAEVIPLLLLPWTLFLVRAAWRLIAQRGWRQDTLSRFLLVWVVVVVLFFSSSSGKLMSYILPAIPALGLLLGRWGLSDPQDSRSDRILWNIGAAGLFLSALVIAGIWLFSYFRIRPLTIYPISGRSVFALIPITVMSVVLLARRGQRSFGGLLSLNAGIMLTAALMLSPLAGKDFNALLHHNSAQVYKELATKLKSEDQVVVFWDYRPALGFYTQGEYIAFQVADELLYGRQLEPERAKEIQDKAQLEKLLQEASGKVFAVVDPHDLEQKFRPLGLATVPTTIPSDPNTLVLELQPPLSQY
ncbi:MAG: glycosyltransferase family 39 protein [Lentisphaerae bacterium]|nr:glycosyltransferase family 39 protein [Lentisphaerota bacterium]